MDYIVNDLGLNALCNQLTDAHQMAVIRYPFAVTMLLTAHKHKMDLLPVLNGLSIPSSKDQTSVMKAVNFFSSFPHKIAEEYREMAKTAAVVRECFPGQALILDQIYNTQQARLGFLFPVAPTATDKAPDLKQPPWATENNRYIWITAPKGIIGWVHPPAQIMLLQIVDHQHKPGEAIRIMNGEEVNQLVLDHVKAIYNRGMDMKPGLERGTHL